MLHIYRYIDSILRKQHSDNINLYDLISHPYQYINDAQRREYFSSFVAELLKARDDLLAICFTYGNKV